MVRTQVSFDKALYRRGRAEAKRLGVSFAELCRRALVKELPHAPPADAPWMRWSGTLASGDPHASSTVDKVVYDRDAP
jgi:hypothetical protein